jgi:hypothetical protein
MVVPLPLISPVVLLLNDGSSSSIERNYHRLTVTLLMILMEEELPSFNSSTTGDINGRGTTIV